MPKEEKFKSPYCKICESCGESGCCDPMICVRGLSKGSKGTYCEGNVAEVLCEAQSFRDIYEHIMNKEGLSIMIGELKEEIEYLYNKNLDKLYT